MAFEINTTAWATGECPYGFVCEDNTSCSSLAFNIPDQLEDQARNDGFDVSHGFQPEMGRHKAIHFARINICNRALEESSWFDKTAEYEKHKL